MSAGGLLDLGLEFLVHLVHKGEDLGDGLVEFHRNFIADRDLGEHFHQVGVLLDVNAGGPGRLDDLLGQNPFTAGNNLRRPRFGLVVDYRYCLVDWFVLFHYQFSLGLGIDNGATGRHHPADQFRHRIFGIARKGQTEQGNVADRLAELFTGGGNKLGLFGGVGVKTDE